MIRRALDAAERHWPLTALGIACLAVLLRVGAIAAVPALRSPLTFEHEWIADSVLAGRGFVFPHLDRDYLSMRPAFVYLCVAVYWLTGHSHVAMLLVQALTTGLATFVVFLIGRRVGGFWCAALAAALTAVEPALWYYDVTRIHPESLQVLLFALTVLSILRLSSAPRPGAALLAGICTGAAVYERGTPIVFAPIALAMIGRWQHLSLARWIRVSLFAAAGFALVLAPWVVRNYRVYGRFVLVMTADSELLWIGNNPNATGFLADADGRPMVTVAPREFLLRLRAADELEQQRIFRDEFWQFVSEHPGRVAALFVRKLSYFWWFGSQEGREHPGGLLSFYKPLFAAALLTAAWGFVTGLRRAAQRPLLLLLTFLVVVSMVQSAFFVEGRHRVTTLPILLVVSAYGLLDLAGRRRPRDPRWLLQPVPGA